jgi:cystathionine beta-lyase/cystathionine gamma-synthase
MKEETKIIHAVPVDPLTGAVSVPVYQTSTFVQESPGVNKGFDYSRSNNPTRQVLENLVAELEEGKLGLAFSSGLAAVDAVVKLLSSGDEIVAVDDIYGGSYRLFTHVYKKLGIRVTYVDSGDVENVRAALNDRTKLVWLESPTNPTLKISDIRAISELAHANGALVVVDNTFASPVLQKPLLLGADIIIHSATKYLAGHSDVIGGVIIAGSEELGQQLKFIQNASGAVLGPWDSWLVIRGIETLCLRVEKQSDNGLRVARFLLDHPDVDQVYYPGLVHHRNHNIAIEQQKGFGGVVSFSLKTDSAQDAVKFVTSTQLFLLAESLGGVKSLLCHPTTMTHKSTPPEVKKSVGVTDSLIRLSCGIEHYSDLITDLDQAFAHVQSVSINQSELALS